MTGDDAILRLWHAAQKDPMADIPDGREGETWETTDIAELFDAMQSWSLDGSGMDKEVDEFLADLEREVEA